MCCTNSQFQIGLEGKKIMAVHIHGDVIVSFITLSLYSLSLLLPPSLSLYSLSLSLCPLPLSLPLSLSRSLYYISSLSPLSSLPLIADAAKLGNEVRWMTSN